MTLKGKKNHYNVKFLKGYGFLVNVKDNKIVLKNAYFYELFYKRKNLEDTGNYLTD